MLKILKHIIPTTMSVFEKNIESFNQSLHMVMDSLKLLKEEVEKTNIHEEECLLKIEQINKNNIYLIEESKLLYNIQDNINKIFNNSNIIKDSIPRVFPYNHYIEREVIKEFHEFKKRLDYQNCYLKLVRGLDNESCSTLTRILKRQELIKDTEGAVFNIFTFEEQELLRKYNKKRREVLKISDNCYVLDKYILPINHFEISVFFDKHGLYKLHSIDSIQNKHIIDVGGYIGDSLLILSPLTNKKVHSFEAQIDNYHLMEQTANLNNLENVVLVNKALGDVEKKTVIYSNNSCSSIIDNFNSKETKDVQQITLDKYVEENKLQVGLIKVDIEGAEQLFLQGAKQTICNQKPSLILSIYHNPEDFFFIKPLLENWNLGYNFQIHKPIDNSVSQETVLICEII